jgi:hypothetical protein
METGQIECRGPELQGCILNFWNFVIVGQHRDESSIRF